MRTCSFSAIRISRISLTLCRYPACHILPPWIQLSGGFELRLQNFTLAVLPFRRIKKINLTRSCNYKPCIDTSDSLRFLHSRRPSVASEIQREFIRPRKFTSAPRKAKRFIGQFMTADDSINVRVRTQAWQPKWAVFKILLFFCKSFLTFLSHPSPLSYSHHFWHGLWLSFLVLC